MSRPTLVEQTEVQRALREQPRYDHSVPVRTRASGILAAALATALVHGGCGGLIDGNTGSREGAGGSGGATGSGGGSDGVGGTGGGAGAAGTGGASGRGGAGGSTATGGSSGSGAMGTRGGGGEPDGGGPTDASTGPVGDATFDAALPATGLAGFALVVNDSVLTPMSCPSSGWEYPWPPGEGRTRGHPPVPGVKDAYIVNTGGVPLAYIAQSQWSQKTHYRPGVSTGASYQLAGVLAPGTQVDITSIYVGNVVALVGASEPFSSTEAEAAFADEATIPWPKGVTGSEGSSVMYVAEIAVPIIESTCITVRPYW